MATYHGFGGVDEQALAIFITGVYDGTRKTVFHGVIPVAHLGLGELESVEYDVATTPRALLTPSTLAAAADQASGASFEIVIDQLAIVLHYADGSSFTTIEGAVRASAGLIADTNGSLIPKLTKVVVDLPTEPTLGEIIDRVLIPVLARHVNDELLHPVRIPPLAFGKVALTEPTITTGDGRLTATTAIAPAHADPAPPIPWPEGRIFIAADFALVNQLAAAFTTKLVPITGTWSKKIDAGIAQSTMKADYRATVTNVTLGPVDGHSDQLRGTATVDVHVHCYAKNLFSVTSSGVTKVGLSGKTTFLDGALAIQLVGLDEFSLRLDIKNVAGWLDKQISNMIAANVVNLRGPLSATLAAQSPVVVGRLPSFELDLRGTKLAIHVRDPLVSTARVPDGRTLLVASGIPNVWVSP